MITENENNPIFYKSINGQNVYLDFFYEPRINLCGKYLASQLNVVISGLNSNYKNLASSGKKHFCIDAEDLASEKNISSDDADIRLREAEDFFNKNRDFNELNENVEISYLLSQVDMFIENPSNKNN